MTVKEQVLLLLETQRDRALSGEELAGQLSVTRAAVWKAIKSLQKDGYAIEAVNNKGYTLKKAPDILSAAYIEQGLKREGFEIPVKTERIVSSTNTVLKQFVAQGQKSDMILLAEEQSGGRGRRGRSFYSPEGTGLYMSLLLHPSMSPEEATMLTTVAAAAEAEALERISGLDVKIKWVNDVWIRNKKISGILTEGSVSMEDGHLEYAIVGIGINIYEPEEGFPEEIKDVAGAVFTNDISRENLRNRIAVEVLSRFLAYYRMLPQKAYLDEYRKRSIAIGKQVRILVPEGAEIPKTENGASREHALVIGIDDLCHLQVQYEDGTTESLSNGEISIKL
ncbi:MAG: biotin--[acetyl-CoA-carboxylase] ligase [Lachnospiraceae bacterium]|nr:biotin--[acetyl-CoA-carboxylase] ligase [Lachnospiraceae bacterium]